MGKDQEMLGFDEDGMGLLLHTLGYFQLLLGDVFRGHTSLYLLLEWQEVRRIGLPLLYVADYTTLSCDWYPNDSSISDLWRS